ncbi:YagK/YfjJ domain-containing protein [Oleidesulfovibrio sp.]|uniref:YagK/YfjJ domain-containing protein n=1 Tax=Oleidesulfovibrio sp. TaxID=2909707 RepID=UPI003A8C2157
MRREYSNSMHYRECEMNTGLDQQYAFCTQIADRIIDRIEHMTRRHNKVLFIRFDLRFPRDFPLDESNNKISRFWKIVGEELGLEGIHFHYVWAREQKAEEHQHYHCVIMLDGNKVQRYRNVLSHFEAIWHGLFDFKASGLVWFCDCDREGNSVKNGIMIRRPSRDATGEQREEQEEQFRRDKDRCIYWGSYLAKQNQKEYAPRRARYYGASQLPLTVMR